MRKARKVRAPRKHNRIIGTLTGPLERRVLQWLAARLPAWVMPDHLTALSLAASALIAVSYLLAARQPGFLWLACLGFVINWFGDSLDGTLARFRKIERPRYGFFVDHSVDAAGEAMVFFSLGLSSYVRFEIAAVALVGYLLLSIYTTLSTYAVGEFKISYAYLGPTEVRLLGILSSIWVFYQPGRFIHLLGGAFTFFELIVLGLTLLFYAAFVFSTVGQLINLASLEPPRK